MAANVMVNMFNIQAHIYRVSFTITKSIVAYSIIESATKMKLILVTRVVYSSMLILKVSGNYL